MNRDCCVNHDTSNAFRVSGNTSGPFAFFVHPSCSS